MSLLSSRQGGKKRINKSHFIIMTLRGSTIEGGKNPKAVNHNNDPSVALISTFISEREERIFRLIRQAQENPDIREFECELRA